MPLADDHAAGVLAEIAGQTCNHVAALLQVLRDALVASYRGPPP